MCRSLRQGTVSERQFIYWDIQHLLLYVAHPTQSVYFSLDSTSMTFWRLYLDFRTKYIFSSCQILLRRGKFILRSSEILSLSLGTRWTHLDVYQTASSSATGSSNPHLVWLQAVNPDWHYFPSSPLFCLNQIPNQRSSKAQLHIHKIRFLEKLQRALKCRKDMFSLLSSVLPSETDTESNIIWGSCHTP